MKLTLINGEMKGIHVVANGREGTIVGVEISLRVKYDAGGSETIPEGDVEYHPMYLDKPRNGEHE